MYFAGIKFNPQQLGKRQCEQRGVSNSPPGFKSVANENKNFHIRDLQEIPCPQERVGLHLYPSRRKQKLRRN